MSDDRERMTATVITTEGEYAQISDWARTLGEMESIITGKYCTGTGEKADWIKEKFFGAVVVRIVRDDHAHLMPEHEYTGD
ncbi:MAG TPA: hypothetical protein VLF39_02630 [Candidatus Saccharimonadales bacterium]|nr:hypothetical protein [Candidatus Saccharimonadales bacterium]